LEPPFPAEEKEVVLSDEISPNWFISFLTSIFSAPNSLFYLLGIAVLFLHFSSNKALSFESTEISGKHFESTQSTEILFVDYRVSDQEVLLSELRENTEVVFLNADSPGIEQIAAALKGRGKVAALHVLSHGAPGSVLIGSDQLNLAALTSSASGSVKKIGEYIASDADILFYGCEAGKGRVGRRFVDALAAATGADIAASETLVGAKRLGGNWNLEVSQGEVEINSFISPRAAAHYSHALPTFTFNTASVAGGELTETKSGVTLTVSNTSGSVSIRSVSSGSDSGSSTALYPNASASATTTYAFSQTVDVSAFKIFTLSDARYRLTPIGGSGPTYGYDGGSPGSYPYAKTSGVSWSGISGFTIVRTDSAAASQYAMVSLTFSIVDSDGSLTAASGVAEPVAIPTTVDTIGEALDVFDFTLTDGGTADALALGVSQVVVNVSGTATDAQRSQITWRLNGPDASNVTGTYSAGADTLTFSGLSISVADGASEVYTVNAYFNDNTSLTDNATVILSVDGDTDLTVLGTGTSMAATTAVTNGTGTLTTVAATIMVYAPEPAGSSSGSALTTQPIVRALDAAGNLDTDFIETVTLSSTGSGTLSGDIDIAAVGGVATFSGVIYSAAVDRESIVISADDEAVGIDLAAITSSAISSEVTATRLVFQVQPNPRFAYSGSSITFASAITVAAVDAIGAVDADFTGSVVLSEVGGAGATEIIFCC
jgi:large repetitive protein